MKTAERIFEAFFVVVLTFFFLTIGVRVFTKVVVVDRLGVSNGFTKLVFFDAFKLDDARRRREKIDWAKIYPFGKAVEERSPAKKPERIIAKISHIFAGYKEFIAPYTTDYLIGNSKLSELEKRYEKIMSYDYESNSKPKDTQLTSDGYWLEVCERIDVVEQATSVADLSAFCRSLNIPLIYVNAPGKNCRYEDYAVSNSIDFSNQNADDLLNVLNDLGVDYCDLRDVLHRENRSHHKMFFAADHHWLPETGLWAARHVSEILNLKFDDMIDVSLFEKDRFSTKIYPQWFLGSQGKKVTLANAKPEDFYLFFPNYASSFHYEIKDKRIDADGDFSILYDMDYFNKRNLYGPSVYNAYIYGDQPLEKIENKLSKNDKHILVVHDSFGDVVVPFLALGVRRVDSIDLRNFNGSLKSYIERERPDIVVVLYYSGSIYDKRKYDFE